MNDVRVDGREVGRIDRAYLFCGHGSHGGSSLGVVPTLARALPAYSRPSALGCVAPTLTGHAGLLREQLRIDVGDVGEDAWGLALLWPDERRSELAARASYPRS